MSHESKLAHEQAPAGLDILEQPDRAEHCTRRGDWKGEPEPRALTNGGQVVSAKADWVGPQLDEPTTHLAQVSRR